MSAYKFKWKPYPETKPGADGKYIITCDYDGARYVVIATFVDYSGEHQPDCWEDEYTELNRDDVKAWAELPKPYYTRPTRRKNIKA